jgi:hypothetical protein
MAYFTKGLEFYDLGNFKKVYAKIFAKKAQNQLNFGLEKWIQIEA